MSRLVTRAGPTISFGRWNKPKGTFPGPSVNVSESVYFLGASRFLNGHIFYYFFGGWFTMTDKPNGQMIYDSVACLGSLMCFPYFHRR